MSDNVKAALTPEEWEGEPGWPILVHQHGQVDTEATVAYRHRMAALALHGQPFGFTREDVRLLSGLGTALTNYHGIVAVESLMGRIAALLPPEGT